MRLVDISLDGVPAPLRKQATRFDLTIVVPTLNEEKNIPILYQSLTKALEGLRWELVIVDDNSSDNSPALMIDMANRNENFRFLRRIGRSGLSTACIEGMMTSAAPIIAVMDADGQHDESKILTMFGILSKDEADIVVGSRFKEGADLGEFDSNRTKLSVTGNHLISRLFEIPLKDSLGGFFMLKREMFEQVVPRLSGRGFKILFDILALSPANTRVAEIPIVFGAREHGESKLSHIVALDFLLQVWDLKFGRYIPPKAILDILSIGGFAAMITIIQWAIMKTSYYFTGSFPPAATVVPIATIPSALIAFFFQKSLTPKRKRTKGIKQLKEIAAFLLIASPFVVLACWVTAGIVVPGDPRLRILFGAALVASLGLNVATSWRKEIVSKR